jgi:hypothetical protein
MSQSPCTASLEVEVLRALLRLARRRSAPTLEAIVIRVPSSAVEPAVRQALRTLIRAELVHVTPKGPRLTLTGFAVAVAMAATPSSAAALPARTSAPLARRRRAA